MKKIATLLMSLALFSCNKNQMELSRASFTVVEGVDDHSPIYFEIQDSNTDSLILNRNNEVSGTNLILSIERELNLLIVTEKIQAIKNKKYEDKLHKDEKGVFISYADTLHKNLAFFPIKEIDYGFSKPQTSDNLLYTNASNDIFFEDKPIGKNELLKTLEGKDHIQLGFSKSLNFEKYLELRILLEELGLKEQVNAMDLIY